MLSIDLMPQGSLDVLVVQGKKGPTEFIEFNLNEVNPNKGRVAIVRTGHWV